MTSNPFTMTYDALWALAEAHDDLTALVKTQSRIKFTGKHRHISRDTVTTGDLPELWLVPLGGTPHLQRTSSSSTVVKRYEFRLVTGDQRVDELLYPLEWELLRALCDWQRVLGALRWRDKPFVVLARPTDSRVGVTDQDLNRGIKGWTSLWTCEVHMQFATSDLLT